MNKTVTFMAIAMLFTSTSAYAFMGKSKSYNVESDFGITGPSKLVVLPKAFRYKTDDAFFYVPFSSIDYTLLENRKIIVSVRGEVITIKAASKRYAASLNDDLTRAISGEFQ